MVCPLGQITQSYESDGYLWQMDLGSWDGEMDVIIYNMYMLPMNYNNGSSEFCADGNSTFARSTEVIYFCSSHNHINTVRESKECSYLIIFSVNCNLY